MVMRMSVVDIIVLGVLILFVLKGFSNGVFKEGISFVGGIVVLVLAFLFKNPVSKFMYQTLPFFKFTGMMSGISVLNIIIYEVIAFMIVATILLLVYELVLKMTNIFEKILRWTFVFALPSKIGGAVVGFVEGVIIVFIGLFICLQFDATRSPVRESKYADMVLTKTPFLGDAIYPVYNSLQEIYKVAEQYKDSEDKEAANLESLDILLKYRAIDVESAEYLLDKGKLELKGANEVIEKYKGKDESKPKEE